MVKYKRVIDYYDWKPNSDYYLKEHIVDRW